MPAITLTSDKCVYFYSSLIKNFSGDAVRLGGWYPAKQCWFNVYLGISVSKRNRTGVSRSHTTAKINVPFQMSLERKINGKFRCFL